MLFVFKISSSKGEDCTTIAFIEIDFLISTENSDIEKGLISQTYSFISSCLMALKPALVIMVNLNLDLISVKVARANTVNITRELDLPSIQLRVR